MVESITPISVISESTFVISGLSTETILNSTQLYARNFRLIVQISEGGPVRIELIQRDGLQSLSEETSDSLLVYGFFYRRGIFNLLLHNLNSSTLVLRVTLDQFGEDHELLWIAISVFLLGFSISVIYIIKNWSIVIRHPVD